MYPNLADLVRDEANRRLKIEEARRKRIENQKKWERAKPKMITGFKLLGATALLVGGLALGNQAINNLPPKEFSKKTARYENKIKELQKDNTSYIAKTEQLETTNKNLAQQNQQLQKNIGLEKNIIANRWKSGRKKHKLRGEGTKNARVHVWKGGSQKQTTVKSTGNIRYSWRDGHKSFIADSVVVELAGHNKKVLEKVYFDRTTSINAHLEKINKPTSTSKGTSTTNYSISLNGSGTNQANVVIWKNGRKYKQEIISGQQFNITWRNPSRTFTADSIVAYLSGYKSKKYGRTTIDDNTPLAFFLEKSSQKQHKLQLDGNKTPSETKIVVWQNNNKLLPKDYGNTYVLNWNCDCEETIIDSIVAKLPGYKTQKRINVSVDDHTIQNFSLERINQKENEQQKSVEKGKTTTVNGLSQAPLKERGDKLILQSGEYTNLLPIEIPRGKTLIIQGGTKIQESEGFEIVTNGGNLEVKGSAANRVFILGGEGIKLENSNDSEISHLYMSNIRDKDRSDGGALTFNNSNVELDNVQLIQNYTVGDGGAIKANKSNIILENSILDKGQANYNGGNIYIIDSKFDIISSDILNGSAKNGGNIFIYNSTGNSKEQQFQYPVFIQKSKINYGTAAEKGGGIFLHKNLLEMQDNIGSANKAEYGGFIYVYQSIINYTKNNFSNNQANISGGGAYIEKTMNLDEFRKLFTDNLPNNYVEK